MPQADDLGYLLHKHPGRAELRDGAGYSVSTSTTGRTPRRPCWPAGSAVPLHEPVFAVLALESEPVDPRL